MLQDNCTIVRRFIEETINQGRIDEAPQFVWEDVVEQVPFPGQGPGLAGLQDVLRGMRNAFPDLYFGVVSSRNRINFRGVKRKMSNYNLRPRKRQRTRRIDISRRIRIVK